MRKQKQKSWKEQNLPFRVVPIQPMPIQVTPFDSVSWVKELLARPVSKIEVQS